MSVEIRVPQLPESVADATLVAWRKQAGEAVSRDENLADLETDKVVLEVPAPVSGVLREIKVQGGTIGQERRAAGGDRGGRRSQRRLQAPAPRPPPCPRWPRPTATARGPRRAQRPRRAPPHPGPAPPRGA